VKAHCAPCPIFFSIAPISALRGASDVEYLHRKNLDKAVELLCDEKQQKGNIGKS
jgi:hypothetical protein